MQLVIALAVEGDAVASLPWSTPKSVWAELCCLPPAPLQPCGVPPACFFVFYNASTKCRGWRPCSSWGGPPQPVPVRV